MTTAKLWFWGIGLVIVLFVFSLIGSYNGLVSQRESVSTQRSQIETQYQRRFDLVPNLVSATRGALAQEQKVFGDIAEARTRYAGAPAGSADKVQATNQMESALSRLLVVMENYPTLQSNQTIRDLMTELTGTENRVGVARQRYNETARDYNIRVKRFPTSILASMFNFQSEPLFEATDAAATPPTVNLELNNG